MMELLYLLSLTLLCLLRGFECYELRYALFTAGPTGGFDTSGAVPAIELAEEIINSDSSILPGYNLTHTAVYDTMCDRTVSLNEYFNVISPQQPTIIGLLGCGCSAASNPVAEIIHHNSISQISYASSSTELSARQRFPNFFRTYPSDTNFPASELALLQKYDWRRVVFIIQDESVLTEPGGSLATCTSSAPLPMEGLAEVDVKIRMGSSQMLLESLNDPDVDFFFEEEDFRVFFLNTDSKTARQIMCEAYMRGFTYPRYAWVTNGWYQSSWWTEEVTPWSGECSDDELAEILHRSLVLEKLPERNDSNTPTDVGLTHSMFNTFYEERLSVEERNNSYHYADSFVATVAYDALWTLALALNKTNEMVQSLTREEILRKTLCNASDDESVIVSLENFTYTNRLMGCIVRWNLERTDFVGVSGHVMFDETGSRTYSQVTVSQYRLLDGGNLTLIDIADIERVNDTLSVFVYKNNQSDQTVYPKTDGGIPPDGTPVTVRVTFHLSLVVIYYVLATAGIIFCTACLMFNFTQRKKKVVRLNSPNLNYIIILGSYIMNISIFFRIMPSTDLTVNAARCTLDTVLNTVGYGLAYGAILAKMGRISYIFHNPTAAKKTLKDWHLVLIALVVAAVGTTLAVLQVTVPILQPIPYLAPNHEPPSTPMNDLGLRVEEMGVFCFDATSRPISAAWIVLTFMYLAVLQLIGIILALRIRKVKIKALRDSKYIVAVIYISALALIIIAISTFVLGNLPNVIELLFSGSLMVATTVFLSMVFIPKMVSLYKDPKGEHVMELGLPSDSIPDSTFVRTNTSGLHSEERTRVSELESRVKELEKSLKDYQHLQLRAVQSFTPPSGTSVDSTSSDIPLFNVRRSHYRVTIDEAAASSTNNHVT